MKLFLFSYLYSDIISIYTLKESYKEKFSTYFQFAFMSGKWTLLCPVDILSKSHLTFLPSELKDEMIRLASLALKCV